MIQCGHKDTKIPTKLCWDSFPPLNTYKAYFSWGRFSHRVAMSVCLCVCLRHQVPAKEVPGEQSSLLLFLRPLIGPQVTLQFQAIFICVLTQNKLNNYQSPTDSYYIGFKFATKNQHSMKQWLFIAKIFKTA